MPDEETCHTDMAIWSLGGDGAIAAGVRIQRVRLSGGVTARRARDLLCDGNDDIVLNIHDNGPFVATQLGREVRAMAGAGFLLSNADPSTVVLPQAAHFISLALPRSVMKALAPGLEDAFARPLHAETGALGLLTRYLATIENGPSLETPELARLVAAHIHDLCALAIGAARDAAATAKGRGLRAARLSVIKADIADNLANGDLSAAELANRQGVTPRYIHKLFESEGTTLSRYVRGLRLARVHRVLADPRHAHLTISALAYDAGFGDLSTFNRDFRRHFGVTPSDIRTAARNRECD
jgi:AraC-like DNA-binding protein